MVSVSSLASAGALSLPVIWRSCASRSCLTWVMFGGRIWPLTSTDPCGRRCNRPSTDCTSLAATVPGARSEPGAMLAAGRPRALCSNSRKLV